MNKGINEAKRLTRNKKREEFYDVQCRVPRCTNYCPPLRIQSCSKGFVFKVLSRSEILVRE